MHRCFPTCRYFFSTVSVAQEMILPFGGNAQPHAAGKQKVLSVPRKPQRPVLVVSDFENTLHDAPVMWGN